MASKDPIFRSNRPLVLVAALIFAVVNSFGQGQTKAVVRGLQGDVIVRRDVRGVPYIEARTDADLYFAQGYVTASDRLWQMDLMRRLARGETAEIFGNAALEQDKRWRRFNFSKVADDSVKLLPQDLRAALEAYAAGVNARIAALGPKDLPVEFQILQYRPRDWTPADTLVTGKILADALSTTWPMDVMRAQAVSLPTEKLDDLLNVLTPYDLVLFGSDISKPSSGDVTATERPGELLAFGERDEQLRRHGLSLVGLYAEDLAASNNWVISGKRTADGRPLLANDPHLQPSAPGIWYMVQLSTPKMRVAGVTVPGAPGVILGHNEHIAWGATNVGPDVQDVYLETFNESGQVRTASGWTPATVRHEVIKVRTSPLRADVADVPVDYVHTPHGPVISDEGGKKYALRWTALDAHNVEFGAFFQLNRARNWGDVQKALRSYGGPMQNFVYADVKGNIGWYAAGKVPVRRVGDGSLPYDGASSDGDWTGYIPFDELPHLFNPPQGLIVTANQRIVGTSYKYSQLVRDAALPWRARVIYDRLSTKQKLTMDDVRDVQYESFNIPLSKLAQEIVKLKAASPETLDVLSNWDGRMTADSRGAVLVNQIRGCVAAKIADANKPAPLTAIRERVLDRAVREQQMRWLPPGYSNYAELLSACDKSSRASLSTSLGVDPSTWTWGRVFVSRFTHPLAAVPLLGSQFSTPAVGLDGSGQTPNVGPGVSMRHIASPGNWDATRLVLPLGESGDPRSPHFKDQFDAWRTGTPLMFPFSAPAVEAATVEKLVLSAR